MIVQMTSHEILSSFRLSHAAISHSFDSANSDSANFDLINFDINLMIKSRDIYNMKVQLRRNELDFMISIQALMHQLIDDD
jgi:hypothetical protein